MYVYCIFICKKKHKKTRQLCRQYQNTVIYIVCCINIYCMLYIDGRYLSFKEYDKGKVLKTDETVQ